MSNVLKRKGRGAYKLLELCTRARTRARTRTQSSIAIVLVRNYHDRLDQRLAWPRFKQPSSTSTVRRGGLSTSTTKSDARHELCDPRMGRENSGIVPGFFPAACGGRVGFWTVLTVSILSAVNPVNPVNPVNTVKKNAALRRRGSVDLGRAIRNRLRLLLLLRFPGECWGLRALRIRLRRQSLGESPWQPLCFLASSFLLFLYLDRCRFRRI